MPTSSRDSLVLGRVIGDVVDQFSPTVALQVSYNGRRLMNDADFRPSAVAAGAPISGSATRLLVTDIPGTTDVGYGREVICYESPRPPAGIHRVVFVLFRQMARGSVDVAPLLRHNFCTRNFAEDHGLGAPVAAAFFTCQPEGGTGGRRLVVRPPRTTPAP
ncbi:protein FLOWERING [Panicum miliaceum]|uniref:Protein FLOWERING n=1 Tax=Panicum miliaceum TaxID=4540 RepID=A0A3L6R1G1_PANMI|nr:protein FLOWERING [Panicum miliaceum]